MTDKSLDQKTGDTPLTRLGRNTSAAMLKKATPSRHTTPVWMRVLSRFARGKTSLAAGAVLFIMILGAVLAPQLAPYDPLEMHYDHLLAPPSRGFLLGTDEAGRDILSRMFHGARVSLIVAAASVAGSMIGGTFLGMVSAMIGGWVDDVIMRLIDAMLGFPVLLLALLIVSILGSGLPNTTLAVAIVGIPTVVRMTRASVLVEKEKEYIVAARVIGASGWRIAVRHILPNAAPILLVVASLGAADAIQTEAALSFLGLGLQPPHASLGVLLKRGYGFITTSPWYTAFPGLTIAVTIWALNTLGDALREAFDPRLLGTA